MCAVVFVQGVFSFPLVLAFVAFVPLDFLQIQIQMISHVVTLQISLVISFVRTFVTFILRSGSCWWFLFVERSVVSVCVVFVQSHCRIGDKITLFVIVLQQFAFFTLLRMAFGQVLHQKKNCVSPYIRNDHT
jgi:hypothetical protein